MEYTDLKRKLSKMNPDQECSGFQLYHYEQMIEHVEHEDSIVDKAEAIAQDWNDMSKEEKLKYAEKEQKLKDEGMNMKRIDKSVAKDKKKSAKHDEVESLKKEIKKLSVSKADEESEEEEEEEDDQKKKLDKNWKDDKDDKDDNDDEDDDEDEKEEKAVVKQKSAGRPKGKSNKKGKSSNKKRSNMRSGCKRRC